MLNDRIQIIDWLANIVNYAADFNNSYYSDSEMKNLAIDALKLLKEPKIVKCGECKYRPQNYGAEIDGEWCYWCELHRSWKSDNWYCADGERR